MGSSDESRTATVGAVLLGVLAAACGPSILVGGDAGGGSGSATGASAAGSTSEDTTAETSTGSQGASSCDRVFNLTSECFPADGLGGDASLPTDCSCCPMDRLCRSRHGLPEGSTVRRAVNGDGMAWCRTAARSRCSATGAWASYRSQVPRSIVGQKCRERDELVHRLTFSVGRPTGAPQQALTSQAPRSTSPSRTVLAVLATSPRTR